MRAVRVGLSDFELGDGSIHPLTPPLIKEVPTERNTLTIKPSQKKGYLTLEGRGKSCNVSEKAYGWLKEKFLKPETVRLTASVLVP